VTLARGALLPAEEHPEWKQLLVHAAYRRAGELDRLRELPDTPMILPVPAPAADEEPVAVQEPVPAAAEEIAALPPPPATTDDDVTATIPEPPTGTMPIELGETSSIELPVARPEVPPPVQKPESLKRQKDSKLKVVRKKRRARVQPPAKPAEAASPSLSLFDLKP
jgi:hypothetical protein